MSLHIWLSVQGFASVSSLSWRPQRSEKPRTRACRGIFRPLLQEQVHCCKNKSIVEGKAQRFFPVIFVYTVSASASRSKQHFRKEHQADKFVLVHLNRLKKTCRKRKLSSFPREATDSGFKIKISSRSCLEPGWLIGGRIFRQKATEL